METSPLICRAIQWTDSYMIGTSLMKTFTVTSEKQIFQNLLIKNTVSLRKQKHQVFDVATNQKILEKKFNFLLCISMKNSNNFINTSIAKGWISTKQTTRGCYLIHKLYHTSNIKAKENAYLFDNDLLLRLPRYNLVMNLNLFLQYSEFQSSFVVYRSLYHSIDCINMA